MKPVIAITMGDPAGIGPEIIAHACHDEEVRENTELILVGRMDMLTRGCQACGLAVPDIEVIETGPMDSVEFGEPGAHTGAMAASYIEAALDMCKSGKAQAMATAPIAKDALKAAGSAYTGHTTMLGGLLGVERPVMMLMGSSLRVVLVTVHCALEEVPGRVTKQAVLEVARTARNDFINRMGIDAPRIGVAGLNPHAGEGGLFGRQEMEIIQPAVDELRAEGFDISDPIPPDTIFWRAVQKQEFDMVLCMYHDQGLIPLKLLHFEDGVNVTLGLPIIRTSVDHGTAFEIAGKNQANPASMKEAILTAAHMARCKARSGK